MVPSRSPGSLGDGTFCLVDKVQQGTGNELQATRKALGVQSLFPVAWSSLLVPGEAAMVSDAGGLMVAGASRDRAVVRMGDGVARGFRTEEARPSRLALLLT